MLRERRREQPVSGGDAVEVYRGDDPVVEVRVVGEPPCAPPLKPGLLAAEGDEVDRPVQGSGVEDPGDLEHRCDARGVVVGAGGLRPGGVIVCGDDDDMVARPLPDTDDVRGEGQRRVEVAVAVRKPPGADREPALLHRGGDVGRRCSPLF